MRAGLYLHVPFCRRKCPYCDFFSLPVSDPPVEEYLRALKKELELRREELEGLVFTTFYVGGGTPSLLPPWFYEELFSFLAGRLSFAPEERTLEANPEGLTPSLLKEYRLLFNRLSLGAQSFSPEGLRVLGRLHTVEQTKEAVLRAQEAGFQNLSLDLIFAWPGQTVEMLAREIEEALSLAPEHLSCYELTVEPGTPFEQAFRRGTLRKPREEEILAMFSLLWERLAAAGFEHYEISNYARPGRRCLHNLFYWRAEPYLGLGAGAASFLGGRRTKNLEDLKGYLSALEQGRRPVGEEEELDSEALFREAVVLGLRLREGVLRRELRERFGFDLAQYYAREIPFLEARGLVHWDGERLRLTARGLLLANVVFRELV
ncbi:MAG: radical SAM family heme chaperone HemW [Thermodesulfobacteria bacterium]|nr:radical SAM family heme chaperone HemW [Thermodesulfobacteriota bacterium]